LGPSAKRRLKAQMKERREIDELFDDCILIKKEKMGKISKEKFEDKFLPEKLTS